MMTDKEMRKVVAQIGLTALTAQKSVLLPSDIKQSIELVSVLLSELVEREVRRNAKSQ